MWCCEKMEQFTNNATEALKNNMDKTYQTTNPLALGVEIGGTKIQVGIGSNEMGLLPGGIIRRQVKRENGAQGILRDIVSMVDELLETNSLTLAEISRIGIGYGGILDSSRGVILKSFQIDGWTNFPLREWSERQWQKPVCIENDASTAGLAEYFLGNGRGCSRLFYITIGSGVGGGWILDGKIDSGQGLGAAEIGHTWVPDPMTGQPMELEQVCSGWAIGRRAREAARDSRTRMEQLAGSIDAIDAKIVYVAAEQSDETAIRILKETCQALAIGINNVVALLHPERVIVGGGVSLMGPLFWTRLQEEFYQRVLPAFASNVELLPAKLQEHVVVIGALCLE
jgi:glucokinase